MLKGKVLVTGGKYKSRRANGTFEKLRTESWNGLNWDDGFKNNKGYFCVYLPAHPSASSTGWVHRAHAVWWLKTGQVIKRGWAIHHKNENKLDDIFDNLQLMEHGEHSRLHSSKPLISCKCECCGEIFYLSIWRLRGGQRRYCSLKCYWQSPRSDVTRQKQSVSLREVYRSGKRKTSSEAMKRCWEQPGFRERASAAMSQGWARRKVQHA